MFGWFDDVLSGCLVWWCAGCLFGFVLWCFVVCVFGVWLCVFVCSFVRLAGWLFVVLCVFGVCLFVCSFVVLSCVCAIGCVFAGVWV